jgi:hypothetical protein
MNYAKINIFPLFPSMEGGRKTFQLEVPIPNDVRAMLADPKQTHIGFSFECPITEMIRIAMLSQTCKSWDNVALSHEDNKGYLDDFCNGERYKRIAEDMSPGGAILGAVLATDGICLDKCMFDSQEVRVVRATLDCILDYVLDCVLDCMLDCILDCVLDCVLDSLQKISFCLCSLPCHRLEPCRVRSFVGMQGSATNV